MFQRTFRKKPVSLVTFFNMKKSMVLNFVLMLSRLRKCLDVLEFKSYENCRLK